MFVNHIYSVSVVNFKSFTTIEAAGNKKHHDLYWLANRIYEELAKRHIESSCNVINENTVSVKTQLKVADKVWRATINAINKLLVNRKHFVISVPDCDLHVIHVEDSGKMVVMTEDNCDIKKELEHYFGFPKDEDAEEAVVSDDAVASDDKVVVVYGFEDELYDVNVAAFDTEEEAREFEARIFDWNANDETRLCHNAEEYYEAVDDVYGYRVARLIDEYGGRVVEPDFLPYSWESVRVVRRAV